MSIMRWELRPYGMYASAMYRQVDGEWVRYADHQAELREEQGESLRQAEIARDALTEVERLTEQLRLANIDALNALTELAHYEGNPCQRCRLERAEARVAELKGILDAALNHSVANRGQAHAFYRCHTLPLGTLPAWVSDAEAALAAEKGEGT